LSLLSESPKVAQHLERSERSAINPYLAGLSLLVIALLQTSAMPSLSLSGVMPDLMLLVVVSWSLLRGTREGLLWALGGGLLLDLLSGGPFGVAVVSLVLSSVIIGMGELNVVRDSLWLPLVASVLATVVYDLAYWAVLQVTGRSLHTVYTLLRVMGPGMMLNALAMYPTYWATRWLSQRTD
jgi:rod shape-determining protein MreD